METTLRVLVALGFGLLLVMLRLQAELFQAADYDERDSSGRPPSLLRRLAWYVMGFALVLAIVLIHPAPGSDLFLGLGDRGGAILGGALFAVLGTAQAAAFAWLRYRRLRLPPVTSYPGALLNALGTSFVDEAAFRGVLLGFLVLVGLDGLTANLVQALTYGLATRLGAPGRDRYVFGLSLGIGLVAGWLTIWTGGVGAAFLGHAITRFAVFVTTGHKGQPAPIGREEEDIERGRTTPEGWRTIGRDPASLER
jgi:membrane protease YdiL (CAAX protease family)